jgi:hypothetical protein
MFRIELHASDSKSIEPEICIRTGVELNDRLADKSGWISPEISERQIGSRFLDKESRDCDQSVKLVIDLS